MLQHGPSLYRGATGPRESHVLVQRLQFTPQARFTGSSRPRVHLALADEQRAIMVHESAVTWLAPSSLHHEFQQIEADLESVTAVPGRLGATARQLVGLLETHFVRQQELVLPPLGLLLPLSRRAMSRDMATLLPLIDRLRDELPRLLDEHLKIARGFDELAGLARLARRPDLVRLSQDVGSYAVIREQIVYPAALVAGDLLRLKLQREPGG
jgi:hypothetical protein